MLIYNGQTDMGKKHIKQALNTDPDCARYQKYWKNLQKADKKKAEAAECFQAGMCGVCEDKEGGAGRSRRSIAFTLMLCVLSVALRL